MQHISTEKMSSLSKQWVEERRGELLAIPQTAGIMPDLESVHKGLRVVLDNPPSLTDPARQISQLQLTKKDPRHDNLLRAGYYHLGSLAALAAANEDFEREEELLSLRTLLYPIGLAGTTIKYAEQEGAAILLEGRLTDAVRLTLKELVLADKGQTLTLLDMVLEQIALAKEIMTLDREKEKLQEAPSTAVTPAEQRSARIRWMATVRALISNLRLAVQNNTTTAATADSLLKELREAEAESIKEHKKKKEAEKLAEEAKKAKEAADAAK